MLRLHKAAKEGSLTPLLPVGSSDVPQALVLLFVSYVQFVIHRGLEQMRTRTGR